jgi:rare lipoprotein A
MNRRILLPVGLAFILSLFLGPMGCRSVESEAAEPAKIVLTPAAHPDPEAKPKPANPVQEGIASWYGPGFHGKKTSNKEIYNMHDLTAAHQTLPFETHVLVTNLENGRSVVVRINDRGPFVKDRIIDLSHAAAQVLDMVAEGTAPVRLEILLDRSPPLDSQKYSVQIGSFSAEENAQALAGELRSKYPGVYIAKFRTSRQTFYRVRIKAESRAGAEAIARRLKAAGYSAIVLEEQ